MWKVHALKLAGGTDRAIADALARDPVRPINVTHQQVSLDWREATKVLAESYREQGEAQRTLAMARLERLLSAVWSRATSVNAQIGAVTEARAIIRDMRALFGLDRELGDPERPITFDVDAEVHIDYRGLSNEQLDFLLELAEQQALRGPEPLALESGAAPEGEGVS